jgi:hypothetical protein
MTEPAAMTDSSDPAAILLILKGNAPFEIYARDIVGRAYRDATPELDPDQVRIESSGYARFVWTDRD